MKVEWHGDSSNFGERKEKFEIFAPVTTRKRNQIPGLHALRNQIIAEAIRAEMKIQISERLRAVMQSELLGKMLRVSWQCFADVHISSFFFASKLFFHFAQKRL
jgi:hypothetical protein